MGEGDTTVAFLADAKTAFLHVAEGNLIKRMKEKKFEADLVR